MTLILRMLLSALLGLSVSTGVMATQPVCKGADTRVSNLPKTLTQDTPATADVFPVVSRHLSPGFIEARGVDVPGLNPVFLVGNDSLSRNWLRANKNLLQRLKATGLVVNVASPNALSELCALADGLVFLPVTGDDLAHLVELEHYPVLITPTYLEQGL